MIEVVSNIGEDAIYDVAFEFVVNLKESGFGVYDSLTIINIALAMVGALGAKELITAEMAWDNLKNDNRRELFIAIFNHINQKGSG